MMGLLAAIVGMLKDVKTVQKKLLTVEELTIYQENTKSLHSDIDYKSFGSFFFFCVVNDNRVNKPFYCDHCYGIRVDLFL